MEQYLDINYLKSLGVKPAWFGLGFIQLKLNETQRMHFWHPHLMQNVPDEEIHDHRYDFTSHILKGSMTHEVWEFIEGKSGPFDLMEVSCKPGVEADPTALAVGDIKLVSSYSMVEGSHYNIHKDLFHRIKASSAITFLTRGAVLKENARIARDRKNPYVCAFSVVMNEEDLWRYIDECINGIPNGYHRATIAKGTFGQSSKILEETLELIDAEKQANKIMGLVELSDLYGAIQGYMEANHPLLSMEDLRIMSETTQRAFRHGKR